MIVCIAYTHLNRINLFYNYHLIYNHHFIFINHILIFYELLQWKIMCRLNVDIYFLFFQNELCLRGVIHSHVNMVKILDYLLDNCIL